MPKTIISEGKTTNEAVEKGLKKLNVSKNMVDIKVIENEAKRSFFDILAPRIVKVELTVKEDMQETKVDVRENRSSSKYKENRVDKDYKSNVEEKISKVFSPANKEDLEKAKQKAEVFLEKLLKNVSEQEYKYNIKIQNDILNITITGENIGFLIGYRGDVLNSLQVIITSILNKGVESRIKVFLDIEGYREKREKSLEELAVKVSKTVLRNGKSITLEPMSSYERKIIHAKLQENDNITTYSVGEDPNRKIVIAKK